jgi:hypothetical protein
LTNTRRPDGGAAFPGALAIGLLLGLAAASTPARSQKAATAPRFELRHAGFETLRRGEFGSAGQNLYVSAAGRIQFVRRWDLDGDGTYDLVFNNTHNRMDVPDAFVYLQTAGGYRSAVSPFFDALPLYEKWRQAELARASLYRLPSLGTSQICLRDLDGDGYPEAILANRTDGFTSTSVSYVYWGSREGYGRRTDLETRTASGVAVGDLDHDGHPDIVFANQGWGGPHVGGYRDNRASYIYWGSAGGYGADRRTSVPTVSATGCALGDLDGDGSLDLIFAGSAGEAPGVQVFWGGPSGPDLKGGSTVAVPDVRQVRFCDAQPFGRCLAAAAKSGVVLLASGSGRELRRLREFPGDAHAVAVADLDGDGGAELVAAGESAGRILWSRDDHRPAQATALPALAPRDVAVADLDGDGRPDVVLANQRSATTYDIPSYVYWGNPWGYGTHRRSELQTFGAVSVAIGDVNRDGKADLAFANTSSALVSGPDTREDSLVYWGAPHRGYSTARVGRYPTNAAMGSVIADLDDDGHPELLFANMADASFLFRGTPSGPSPRRPRELRFAGSAPHNAFEVADLDRDGWLDVLLTTRVSATAGGCTVLLRGSAAGISDRRSVSIPYDLKGVANPRLADLDGDGRLDLFLPASYDTRSAILWGGTEPFSMRRSTLIDEPHVGNVEFADLDRDGFLDLILCKVFDLGEPNHRAGSRIRIRYGGPKGFFERPATELPVRGALDVVVADLNQDGALDIGVAQYSGGDRADLPFVIFWNDGQGRFAPGNRNEALPGYGGTAALAADFDDDGRIDLAVFHHQLAGNHNVDSFIYWGAPEGFSARNATALPAAGPHWAENADIGNLYTRRLEETYTSVPVELPAGLARVELAAEARTPLGSTVRLEVRVASERAGLARRPWEKLAPVGARVGPSERWLQYRVVLVGGRGDATPYLEGVTIRGFDGN